MGFANLMIYARIEQNTLGGCGFTCVNMSHDTNITGHFQRYISCHIPSILCYTLNLPASAVYETKFII